MKTLYCDMDGVLADFGKGAAALVNDFLEMYPTDEALASGFENGEPIPDPLNYSILLKKLEEARKTSVTAEDLEKEEYRDNSSVIPEARRLMKSLVRDAGEDWWANLPWMPGGKTLWKGLKKYSPVILTAPMAGATGCAEGKLAWVAENLGEVETILEDEKFHYAKGNVIVDDFQSNTVPWEKSGGEAVLHIAPSATKSLKKVGELLS